MKKEYADYLLKKTKEDYDEIAKEFSDTRYSVWEEFSIFKDYIKDNDKILDLGCGNGRLIELFKGKDIEYIGIDNSEKLIEIAKEKSKIQKESVRAAGWWEGWSPKSKIQFLVADALKLPFPENYFDKIFSIAVLHHIPSREYREQFLKEAKRVLKPGGLLILTVWNLWQKPKTLCLILKHTLLKILGISKLDFKDIFVPWQNQIGARSARALSPFGHPALSIFFRKGWVGRLGILMTIWSSLLARRVRGCRNFNLLKFRDDKILRYVHCFTEGELEKLVKEAGLKIKRTGILRRGETPYQSLRHSTGLRLAEVASATQAGRAKNYNFYLIAGK